MLRVFQVRGKKEGLEIAKIKYRIMESQFRFHPVNYPGNEKAVLQSSF